MLVILSVLALLCISNAFAFNTMKASPIVARKSLKMMSPLDMPIDVLPTKVDMISQASLLVAATGDPGPTEAFLGFLFIATCFMGFFQDFLAAFEKKK